MSLFHVLLIGDVNGKPGRKAIASIVPKLKMRFGDLKFIIATRRRSGRVVYDFEFG